MPVFQYDAYRNPYGPSIAEALAHQADPQAAAALRSGDIEARAAQQQGALRAQQFAQLGAIPGAIQAQRAEAQQQQARAQQLEIGGLQLDTARREAKSRNVFEAESQNPANQRPDGLIDEDKFLAAVRRQDVGAYQKAVALKQANQQASLAWTKGIAGLAASQATVEEKQAAALKLRQDFLGTIALSTHSGLEAHPDNPLAARDDALKMATLAVAANAVSPGIANQWIRDLAGAGPDQVKARLLSVVPPEMKAKYDKEQANAAQSRAAAGKPINVGAGDTLVSPPNPATPGAPPTVYYTAPPKDEHSPIYKEWQDDVANGGTLTFDQYQTKDANRHRPVSITNAATDDKMIADAARNILANPRDLTSIKTITSLRGDQRLKLFNTIKDLDPTFNVGNIDRQIKFLDSYEDPKGRAALNRGAMNNILQHAADLSAVNEGYRRTNLRLVNTPIAVLSREGGTAWQQFATPLAVLKDEIALYFAGGYAPTSDQQKTWDRIANDTATPAQIEQFAKDIIHVGLRRADTHNEAFKTMMGYDDPNLITPQAAAAGVRLGLGDAVKKYGSGGQIGGRAAPAAPVAVPAPVVTALQSVGVGRHTLSDGSVWEKHPDGSIVKAQ